MDPFNFYQRLRTVQRPSGTFKADVIRILSYRPETGQSPFFGTFHDLSNTSLRFVERFFPEINEDLVIDVYGCWE